MGGGIFDKAVLIYLLPSSGCSLSGFWETLHGSPGYAAYNAQQQSDIDFVRLTEQVNAFLQFLPFSIFIECI
jgi:hypothetical protein